MLGKNSSQTQRVRNPETDHSGLSDAERDLKLGYLAQAYKWVSQENSMRLSSDARQETQLVDMAK